MFCFPVLLLYQVHFWHRTAWRYLHKVFKCLTPSCHLSLSSKPLPQRGLLHQAIYVVLLPTHHLSHFCFNFFHRSYHYLEIFLCLLSDPITTGTLSINIICPIYLTSRRSLYVLDTQLVFVE